MTTLADPAIQTVLERGMVARLATMSRSGRPHVSPNYFVLDGSRLWLGTTTGTLTARNVAANPTVRVLVENERDSEDERLVLIAGIATIRTDQGLLREYKRRDARKYFRTLQGLLMSIRHLRRLLLTSRYLSSSDASSRHCVIEIAPTVIEMLESPERHR